MSTTDICLKEEVHKDLQRLKDTLDMKSFSELIAYLIEEYMEAPPGIPSEAYRIKKEKYMDSYPDAFKKATKMCLGITDPQEFDAVFEEAIHDLIIQEETPKDESFLILECSRCGSVWKYKGRKTVKEIKQIHCPSCQATASKKWVRELLVPT